MGAGHFIVISVTINITYMCAACVISHSFPLRILWGCAGPLSFFFLFPSFGRAVQNGKQINAFFASLL